MIRVVGEQLADGPGGLDPAHAGHAHVHQDQVGGQLLDPGQRLLAVGGLTHHLDVLLGLENHLEAAPEQLVVVGDDDSNGLRSYGFRSNCVGTAAGARGAH